MHAVFSLWRRYPHGFAVALVLAATAARYLFAASGQLDLVQDEAQYWDWSRHLQLSYYSKGPLIAWIIRASTAFWGVTEFGVRFGAVLGSLAAQLLLYGLVGILMQKPRLALISLFILNTTFLFQASGILMTTDNPLLVCWLAALLCLHASVVKPDARWPWIGLALAAAFGILAKYTMLGMAGIALLHALILLRQGLLPEGHMKKLGLAFGAGIVIGFLPIVLWNAANDWASFRHVGRLAGVAPAPGEAPPFLRFDRLPEYLGGQLGLVFPWWLAFMVYGGIVAAGQCLRRAAPDSQREKREAAEAALLCSGFWPIFLFFLVWSLHTRIYANWSAMCYASGVVLAAYGVDRVLEKYRADVDVWKNAAPSTPIPWTRRLLPVWAGLSVFFCLLLYAQEPLSRVLPEAVNPTMRLKGWDDLGRRVGELRNSLPDPDKVFVFSDQYDVTAQLAFYVPGQPAAYCADFGRRLSQYDFWPGPQDKKGWDAIFVRRKPFDEPPEALRSMFLQRGTPEIYRSTHRGAPGREFGILVLRGFTGEWPSMSRGIY
ncbi:Glycosyl transferase family 39 [uncultured delta proteobacterium]|uniref:Glycosyl transferase family 39 n=1 Tax=uncultured delta proteobacterium TaxID=34034 RepID=A0A212KF15_9DELT|nr:Glycosyl transferase family 39 [uncultured delta proteobacterium]